MAALEVQCDMIMHGLHGLRTDLRLGYNVGVMMSSKNEFLTSPSTLRSLFLSDRRNITRSAMFASALCVKLKASSEGVMNEFARRAAFTANAHGPLSKSITHSCFSGVACERIQMERK